MRINTVLLLLLGMFIIRSTTLAQVVVNVTAPAGLENSYQAGFADYGPAIADQVFSGQLVYLDGADSLGCDAIGQDLTGKIALIDRGGCNFSLKAYNAQQAGAIAVILALEAGRQLSFVMPAGDMADEVTIPMVSLLESEHIPLKQALTISDVEIEIKVEDEFAGANTVYAEDFDGGLGDWTIAFPEMPDSPWMWSEFGQSQQSVFFVNGPSSQTNGAAVFDASYFNRDVGGSPPYPAYTAELISPLIDVSDHEALNLVFYQSNWPLNSRNGGPQTFFQYSTDGGTVYSDIIPITTENIFTATQTVAVHTETVRLLLEDLMFTENLRLKFTFSGDFYFWGLDDIKLIAPPEYDLAVEDSGYPVRSFATPTAFMKNERMEFISALLNAGSVDQFDSDASVAIVDDQQTYHSETQLHTLSAFGRDTISFAPYWPALDAGEYEIVYSYDNSGVTDEVPENNSMRWPFVVTDNVFAQEQASQDEILSGFTASTGNYFFGTVVSLENLSSPCDFQGLELAAFTADGEFDDENFAIYIMKWIDDNDGYPQFAELNESTLSPLDRPENFEIIAVGNVQPPASQGQHELFDFSIDNGQWFDEEFESITELQLEAGVYVIVGGFEDESIGFSTVIGEPTSGASILYNVNANSPMTYFTGFTNNSVPVIRTIVDCVVEDISSVRPIAENSSITIQPTITSGEAYLNIEDNLSGTLEIDVFTMQGRLIARQSIETFSGQQVAIGLENTISGTYIVKVSSEEGSWSQKVVKQ